MRRLALVAVGLAAALPTSIADARDPIMPLAQVRAGMHCVGSTVVHGTVPTSFDADVVDVVSDVGDGHGPEILIRVSGPAVDVTGVGEGFSGTPIFCKDPQGVARNVGGIGYGLGDFGNKLALVTPIEAMLAEPVVPPARMRSLSARERASVRALAAPLTVSGLAPDLARRVSAAARSRGRTLVAVPALSRAFPVQRLRPGGSVSAGFSSGAVGINALGTVTYVDGDSVWAFGHPLDDIGRRNLLLQDAYVYTVVGNPNGDVGVSYKLGAPGHTVGVLSGDMINGITGVMGVMPKTTRLTVRARDGDTGRRLTSRTTVADELALDSTSGISPLGLAAPLAVLDAAGRVLRSEPGRTTVRTCVKAIVAFRAYPLGFCNRYVGDVGLGGSGEVLAANDVDAATALLESAQFRGLRVKALDVRLDLRRGLDQAYLERVSAPRRVGAGRKLHVTARTLIARGPQRTFRFDVRVPRSLAPGRYKLVLSGPGPDGSGSGDQLSQLLAELVGGGGGSDVGPTSYEDLAFQFEDLHRYDGLTAQFVPTPRKRRPHSARRRPSSRFHAYRSSAFRIGGRASTPVRITRP